MKSNVMPRTHEFLFNILHSFDNILSKLAMAKFVSFSSSADLFLSETGAPANHVCLSNRTYRPHYTSTVSSGVLSTSCSTVISKQPALGIQVDYNYMCEGLLVLLLSWFQNKRSQNYVIFHGETFQIFQAYQS